MSEKGLVHIYTGDGKGKTTAAVGLAVRAHGQGMNVCMVQFLKCKDSGELETIKKLGGGFELLRSKGIDKFVSQMDDKEKEQCKRETIALFNKATGILADKDIDLLILDEVFGAIRSGMLDVCAVRDFLNSKPDMLEIAMTGRDAPEELVEIADYVMDIQSVKHPFDRGIAARRGIEY